MERIKLTNIVLLFFFARSALFSKNDKLGRVVDWNQESTQSYDNRPSAAGGAQAPRRTQTGATGGAPSGGKYGREPKEAFGAGSAGTFAYFHDEDEASFSLVDGSKSGGAKRGGAAGGGGGGGAGLTNLGRTGQFNRGGGRGGARGGAVAGGRGGASGGAYGRGGAQGGRQDFGGRGGRGGARGGAQAGGRFGWKDWNKEARTRDASVVIASDWAVLEEIEFSRLAKLRLEVDTDEPETMYVVTFSIL